MCYFRYKVLQNGIVVNNKAVFSAPIKIDEFKTERCSNPSCITSTVTAASPEYDLVDFLSRHTLQWPIKDVI